MYIAVSGDSTSLLNAENPLISKLTAITNSEMPLASFNNFLKVLCNLKSPLNNLLLLLKIINKT